MKSLSTLDMERAFRDEGCVFRQFSWAWRTEEYRPYVFAAFVKTLHTIGTDKKGELLDQFTKIISDVNEEEGPKGKLTYLKGLCSVFLKVLKMRRINAKKATWMSLLKSFGLLMSRNIFEDLLEEEE